MFFIKSAAGFVTLLATFNYGGLQIRNEHGDWMAAPQRPNSLVMNIGDMLSAMSGGKFKVIIDEDNDDENDDDDEDDDKDYDDDDYE
jgi:hypothetical protein